MGIGLVVVGVLFLLIGTLRMPAEVRTAKWWKALPLELWERFCETVRSPFTSVLFGGALLVYGLLVLS